MGQGKNYKQKKSNSKIEVKSRISSSGESVSGGSSGDGSSMECFQFKLEEPSKLVKKVVIGEIVFGDFSERILIMANIGELGFAPKNVSKKILLIANRKEVSIQGTIVEKIGNENVEVKICL